MLKRQRILSFVLCFTITLMFTKCGYLMLKPFFTNENETENNYTTEVSVSRGNIYDRNGEKLVNDTEETTLLVKPTDNSIRFLKEKLKTNDFIEIQESLLKGRPTIKNIDFYLPENEDIIQLKTFTRYSDSNILRHIIGYVDMNNQGVCGIEKAYEKILNTENRTIKSTFSVSGMNTVLVGEKVRVSTNDYYSVSGVKLTIDKDIQKICEESTDAYNVERGAVVVLDVKTSEILAVVSRPNYDADNVDESLNNENSPLINRALSAYSTGSVFKLVVSAASIEQGVSEVYNCTGKIQIGDITFNCHKEDGHGMTNLEDAISKSCNTYFINLAEKVGKEKIIKTAEKLGFGKSITLCDYIVSDAGNLPDGDEINSDASLANLSFGQGALTSTPLQIAAMTSTIANNGCYTTPTLISGVVDKNGNTQKEIPEAPNKVISDEVCRFLREAMAKAIEDGTGKDAKPINSSAGVKTSTAENSDGTFNSWVTGFFPKDDPKYVISVIKEDGTSGGGDCGPIFKRIAEKITLLSR